MAMVQPEIAKSTFVYYSPATATFYRGNYVPAADGRRHLAASGELRDRSLIPVANLLGSLENWR